MTTATKLDRVVTYNEEFPSIKLDQNNVVLHGNVTN